MSRFRVVDGSDIATRAWKGHGFTLARGLRGFSMEDVADAVGVSHMDMLAYEQERATPPDGVVAAVARHVEMPPGFFEREHTRFPSGDVFMCPAPDDVERCSEAACREPVEAACDFPVGDGKTCDLAMCLDHRVMIEEDVDICVFHRKFIVSDNNGSTGERSRPRERKSKSPRAAASTPRTEGEA